MKIDPEFKALIPPLKPDELAGLEESIAKDGVRDPLVVWSEEDILLDGHHRYGIATKLRKPFNTVGMSFPSRDAAKTWLITNQFARRNLTPAERCNLVYKLKEILAPIARARMLAGKKVPHGMDAERTNEALGKLAGVSKELFRQFEDVIKSGDEETIQQMLANEKSISSAYRLLTPRRIKRENLIRKAKLEKEPLPLPSGKFRCIVADPPWPVDGLPYPAMTVDKICAMAPEVQARAHEEGCALWLWAINSMLPAALEVVKAWGFEYRTILTWDKVKAWLGVPLPNVTEHAILAVRGEPRFVQGHGGEQTTLLRVKKVPEHSRKPDEFYRIVEALCLPPRLELFSRKPRAGWVVWGDEAH